MPTALTYRNATTYLLDAAEATDLGPRLSASINVDQIATHVRTQLREPVGYPPLAQATVPGDRVVLAIQPGMPQTISIIDGALKATKDAGVEDALITVLLAGQRKSAETLTAELRELGHDGCQVRVHDPGDEKETTFLGVSRSGQAVRLNRVLCEADFVLPIIVTAGELRQGETPLSFQGLYPDFSDRGTIERFSVASADYFPAIDSDSMVEIEACGRQLGVGITVQVVPSPGGQVAEVISGDPEIVARQAQEKYREIWCCTSEVLGNLVIATLTGGAEQQTWKNVGLAIAAAEAVLESGGSIAICSELAEPPGRAISRLAGEEDYLVAEREILRDPSIDNGPAMQLCRSLQRGAIYLRSNLRASVVESLGITPLRADSELERLAQTLRPCVVLEEAQRLLPTVNEAEE